MDTINKPFTLEDLTNFSKELFTGTGRNEPCKLFLILGKKNYDEAKATLEIHNKKYKTNESIEEDIIISNIEGD